MPGVTWYPPPGAQPKPVVEATGYDEDDFEAEDEDEDCAHAPRSPTGRQGSDLVAAKIARQEGTWSPKPNSEDPPLPILGKPLAEAEVEVVEKEGEEGDVSRVHLATQYAAARLGLGPEQPDPAVAEYIKEAYGEVAAEKACAPSPMMTAQSRLAAKLGKVRRGATAAASPVARFLAQ